MKLTKVSTLTGKENTVELPLTQAEFDAGELQRSRGWLTQQVYPNLDRWDREFLISGITRKEWEETFGTFGTTEQKTNSNEKQPTQVDSTNKIQG